MRFTIRCFNPPGGSKPMGELEMSKTSSVLQLKRTIAEHFKVSSERIRVIGCGKQLEDLHKIFEYRFQDRAVLDVTIRPDLFEVQEPVPKKRRQDEEEESKVTAEPKAVKSEYFAVGDLVDATDPNADFAWFPAIIKKIEEWDLNLVDDGCITETDGLQYWVVYEGREEEGEGRVRLGQLRPRTGSRRDPSQVSIGDGVLVNYNVENPGKLGFWYEGIVKSAYHPKSKKLICSIKRHDGSVTPSVEVFLSAGLYPLLPRSKLADRNMEDNPKTYPLRQCRPRCDTCGDIKSKKCRECGCNACGGKDGAAEMVLCDQCNMSFHLRCADLKSIPEEDWYCKECKNDAVIVEAGSALLKSEKLAKMKCSTTLSKRDWGKGMATAGRDSAISWVPKGHYGEIRGIHVGMTWTYRAQVSSWGVHRPMVGGIHGRGGKGGGCYSVVIAGGYEDDVDNGDVIIFTGSGGRNLKDGNKRCGDQVMDQELVGGNLGLAYNCTGRNDPPTICAMALDWKKTRPIRVCRSAKGRKDSKFAPEEGIRYDGIYRIEKYWREKGKSNFLVYRFKLRRDDDSPAPWTGEGKAFMKKMGYNKVVGKDADVNNVWTRNFSPSDEELALIDKDTVNKERWKSCLDMVPCVEIAFLRKINEVMICNICRDVPVQPSNSPCGHLLCMGCAKKHVRESSSCPECRADWGDGYCPKVNANLSKALRVFLPGYDGEH